VALKARLTKSTAITTTAAAAVFDRENSKDDNTSELNRDLERILGGARPREYGQCPKVLGHYQMIAPHTEYHATAMNMKRRIVRV